MAGGPVADLATIRRLDALADLDRISASAQVSTVLVEKGYDSVLAVAGVPRSEFVSQVGDATTGVSAAAATTLHVMATAQADILNNILIALAADKANGFTPPDGSTPPAESDK